MTNTCQAFNWNPVAGAKQHFGPVCLTDSRKFVEWKMDGHHSFDCTVTPKFHQWVYVFGIDLQQPWSHLQQFGTDRRHEIFGEGLSPWHCETLKACPQMGLTLGSLSGNLASNKEIELPWAIFSLCFPQRLFGTSFSLSEPCLLGHHCEISSFGVCFNSKSGRARPPLSRQWSGNGCTEPQLRCTVPQRQWPGFTQKVQLHSSLGQNWKEPFDWTPFDSWAIELEQIHLGRSPQFLQRWRWVLMLHWSLKDQKPQETGNQCRMAPEKALWSTIETISHCSHHCCSPATHCIASLWTSWFNPPDPVPCWWCTSKSIELPQLALSTLSRAHEAWTRTAMATLELRLCVTGNWHLLGIGITLQKNHCGDDLNGVWIVMEDGSMLQPARHESVTIVTISMWMDKLGADGCSPHTQAVQMHGNWGNGLCWQANSASRIQVSCPECPKRRGSRKWNSDLNETCNWVCDRGVHFHISSKFKQQMLHEWLCEQQHRDPKSQTNSGFLSWVRQECWKGLGVSNWSCDCNFKNVLFVPRKINAFPSSACSYMFCWIVMPPRT